MDTPEAGKKNENCNSIMCGKKKLERASLVKVIAIRVLNMPTEDWQLMLLGGSHATLLNLDLCSVTTASFSCLRCVLVRCLGMACSIGWRSLFVTVFIVEAHQTRVLM